MDKNTFWNKPHRRFNPLLREWILVSPQRTERPWQGKLEKSAESPGAAYDPACYLCPGNARADGHRNPNYDSTFVFDNDFPALLPAESAGESPASGPILNAQSESGVCRVVCFSPRHDLTLARMSAVEMRAVVETWTRETRALEALAWIRHVQIFENRGALMGASNPHPHCQIWAESSVPNLPRRELESLQAYREEKNACLLCDYLREEIAQKQRVVFENRGFVALVPFWAVWPFEMMILSKRHVGSLLEFNGEEQADFGDVLRRAAIRYDNLFAAPFPYSLGLHQRPSGQGEVPAWHFHAHFLPPLLRSATIQKFMVGYELLAGPQRDITPEEAAARLAAQAEVHYLD